jgi:hypothetical protein
VTENELSLTLQAFARRRPFRPFIVEFFNGERIWVKHPEAVARFSGVWLFQEIDGDRIVFGSTSVCRILDVPQGSP